MVLYLCVVGKGRGNYVLFVLVSSLLPWLLFIIVVMSRLIIYFLIQTRGRGRGKATKLGNRTTSNASLASYEDTENEGEVRCEELE